MPELLLVHLQAPASTTDPPAGTSELLGFPTNRESGVCFLTDVAVNTSVSTVLTERTTILHVMLVGCQSTAMYEALDPHTCSCSVAAAGQQYPAADYHCCNSFQLWWPWLILFQQQCQQG
jgi:hypothetical protein